MLRPATLLRPKHCVPDQLKTRALIADGGKTPCEAQREGRTRDGTWEQQVRPACKQGWLWGSMRRTWVC